jgi:hypothetical protein
MDVILGLVPWITFHPDAKPSLIVMAAQAAIHVISRASADNGLTAL